MTEMVKAEGPSLVRDLARAVGLESGKFYEAVKRQCGCQGATDADFAALLMTAKAYDLNPVMRELWLIDTGRGIRATVSVDGFLKIMARHPDYLSHCYAVHDGPGGTYGEVTIYTRSQVAAGVPPFTHREYLREVQKRAGPWQTHPMRMLEGRTVSQGVRFRFAISAPDADEAMLDAAKTVPADVRPTLEIPSIAAQETVTETVAEVIDFDAAESRKLDAAAAAEASGSEQAGLRR